ncbi:accessory gene regulator ArgB-like protein [Cohnella caldifontis]|uniref:accessory gene regulator ArgB-like protein n=1 Tax=Cohnella caldifontis TaxID=3027471 RepID=UPI0023ECB1EA|nr:accessory gene regulator B family protein [Cohnella sp. YIM B05605]
MVEQLANKIAVKIHETNPEGTASVEVMRYALVGLLHNGFTISAALIVGLFAGTFSETLLGVVSLMTLRLVSGGYHFSSMLACSIFSFSVFVAIPFIPVNHETALIVNAVSLVLCLIFSPSNIKEHIRVSEKYFFVFKLLSIMMVVSNFFLLNPIITLGFFAQSLLLITFWKGR